jgi:hypothetical protein
MVLVKADLTAVIRNVEATTRKVGWLSFAILLALILDRPASEECPGTKGLWASGWSTMTPAFVS